MSNVLRNGSVVDLPVSQTTLEQKKNEAAHRINGIKRKRQASTLSVDVGGSTYTWTCNEVEVSRMANIISAVDSSLITAPAYWRTHDDQNVTITLAQFKTLASTLYTYLMGLGSRAHALKDTDIPAAADQAALDAIVTAYETYDPLA